MADINKLIDLFSFKYSTTIKAENDSSDFTINFPVPIHLDKTFNYELGLLWFSGWNTIFNVTKKNNLIKINGRGLEITPGAYEIKQLDEEINRLFPATKDNSVSISAQLTTGKCIMTMNKCIVIFETNSLAPLLGFKEFSYGSTTKTIVSYSEDTINITEINSINVECDLISGSYDSKGIQNSILYSFPSNTVPAGYKFIERMNPPIYLPITRKDISSIRFRVIDHNDKLIDFNSEKICMYLHLRQV